MKYVFAILIVIWCVTNYHTQGSAAKEPGKETWGYVEVRKGAFMFWWLYCTNAVPDYKQRPLVIWLQGGPGASSTGYGNFMEVGPLDQNLKNRTHTWAEHVNLLFIDSPVGTGYSYVTNNSLLATNNAQIADDLLEMFTRFLEKVPEFQSVPIYIFSESYGGKMAAQFALSLSKQIEKGKVKCSFKGVALGDSWISPVDSVLTWAPYLFSTSLVDNGGYYAINSSAYAVKEAIEKGLWRKATSLWDKTEQIVSKYTNNVNVYNILNTMPDSKPASSEHSQNDVSSNEVPTVKKIIDNFLAPFQTHYNSQRLGESDSEHISGLGSKYLKPFHADQLSQLMNGPIKEMLRIIPANVTWGGQKTLVFNALTEDFMKPVVHIVQNLLNNTALSVSVYTGQLDLIVDTMGTLKWVEEMQWPEKDGWGKSPRKPVLINSSTEMFVKAYKNFGFYWVLKAGHMVPQDAPETALEMMFLVTGVNKK